MQGLTTLTCEITFQTGFAIVWRVLQNPRIEPLRHKIKLYDSLGNFSQPIGEFFFKF
jgi:hypothetical protein